MKEKGFSPDRIWNRSFGHHMGDGIDIAVQAGGKDRSDKASYLRETTIGDVIFATPLSLFCFTNGRSFWFNQDGERFADENCLHITSGCMSNAHANQKMTYGIFTKEIADTQGMDVPALADEAIEDGNPNIVKCETLEEIAEAFDIPFETLKENVDRYNMFCDQQMDDDYNKDPETLIHLDPPYYGVRYSMCIMTSIGGIETNRRMEVLRPDETAVPGLYAVGVDGCKLYGETYTIAVCGSANGNNVNSGRVAAKNAVEYLGL